MENRTPLVWELDRIFHDVLNDCLAIKLNRADANGRKLFSIELGRMNKEGKFLRHLNSRIGRGSNFRATATFPDLSVYSRLLDDVTSHIETELQSITDADLDRRREKEEADANRGKPKVLPGLKSLSKKDAAHRA
jgi:hypothetical protein